MYISKIKLHNFKGFKGDHELNFDSGVNFFVGDNNCGKSSVFEAIDFIRTSKAKKDIITKTEINNYVSVEIEFAGTDLDALLEKEALNKYKSYLIDTAGTKTLRVIRSSEETKIKQNKKDKTLSIKNVRIYSPKTKEFENPTGIDNTITALFDAQFVWADTNSGDVADFSKTKICGKIINTIISNKVSDSWKNFKKSHKETFKKIADNLKPIEEKIQSKLSEQYGDTEVKFTFTLPEITDFLKLGNIVLSDNGIETSSAEKGTGMQRSLALALIQVYADISSNSEKTIPTPIMFFIDEPETFLHPQAQNKLLDALEKISEESQIFVITHSPYLLKKYKKDTHLLNIFEKDNGFNKQPKLDVELALFGKLSPTWGEINYRAFGFITEDFHNELYGFIQAKAVSEDIENEKEEQFDNYLCKKGIVKDKKWIAVRQGKTDEKCRTLPTYIRNFIHHPENDKNEKYTDEELKNSIKKLIDLIKGQENRKN
ncbi:MAG: ATP-binding protein [Endomicrobium sp.]|jgi:predicted ATP-dependent endonuclease of OLD family|nr:ATP-binding protein [Endomicrobium sp.]